MLTGFFALSRLSDAGDVAEEVSESAAEDVAFVTWHLQRFLDSIGESVAGEAEVFEHGYEQGGKSVGSNNSSSELRKFLSMVMNKVANQ